MKSKLGWIVGTSLGLNLLSAFGAGGISGGGGGAIVCRSANKAVTQVKILDLWESALEGRKIQYSNESPEIQVAKKLSFLIQRNPGFGQMVSKELELAKKRVSYLPKHIAIAPPQDALNDLQEEGCTLEGVAKYNDEKGVLYIKRELFEKLPKTEQAALWLHEAIYRVLRLTENAQDSRSARVLTAALFNGYSWRSPVVFPAGLKVHHCSSDQREAEIEVAANSETGEIFTKVLRNHGVWVIEPTLGSNTNARAAEIISHLGRPDDGGLCAKYTGQPDPMDYCSYSVSLSVPQPPTDLSPNFWSELMVALPGTQGLPPIQLWLDHDSMNCD